MGYFLLLQNSLVTTKGTCAALLDRSALSVMHERKNGTSSISSNSREWRTNRERLFKHSSAKKNISASKMFFPLQSVFPSSTELFRFALPLEVCQIFRASYESYFFPGEAACCLGLVCYTAALWFWEQTQKQSRTCSH